jgi:hypothetical protein
MASRTGTILVASLYAGRITYVDLLSSFVISKLILHLTYNGPASSFPSRIPIPASFLIAFL